MLIILILLIIILILTIVRNLLLMLINMVNKKSAWFWYRKGLGKSLNVFFGENFGRIEPDLLSSDHKTGKTFLKKRKRFSKRENVPYERKTFPKKRKRFLFERKPFFPARNRFEFQRIVFFGENRSFFEPNDCRN